jgi:hypothetical protein
VTANRHLAIVRQIATKRYQTSTDSYQTVEDKAPDSYWWLNITASPSRRLPRVGIAIVSATASLPRIDVDCQQNEANKQAS